MGWAPTEGTRNWNANGNANGETGSQAGDEIVEGLLDSGVAVIWLLPALGYEPGGKNLMSQLERCGPGGGANYEEGGGPTARPAAAPPHSSEDSPALSERWRYLGEAEATVTVTVTVTVDDSDADARR